MKSFILKINKSNKEKGATMLEYALMASLIAVVALGGISYLGQQANQTFQTTYIAMEGRARPGACGLPFGCN